MIIAVTGSIIMAIDLQFFKRLNKQTDTDFTKI